MGAPSARPTRPDIPPLPPDAEQVLFALKAEIRAEIAQYASPIPPPEVMEHYEAILPGSTDRILKMAEAQSAHRIGIENTVLGADSRRADKGLYAGTAIGLAGMIAVLVGFVTGHSVAPLVLAFGTLATLTGVFVYGTQDRRREREARVQQMMSPQLTTARQQSQPSEE